MSAANEVSLEKTFILQHVGDHNLIINNNEFGKYNIFRKIQYLQNKVNSNIENM